MGIINLYEDEKFLQGMVKQRTLAAIPCGAKYRLVDFTLSNMVNSDISNVGILVQNKYRSLMEHLRSGQEWNLDRKKDGLFILPPVDFSRMGRLQGDLHSFFHHLDFIKRSTQKYVVLAGSRVICNLDYKIILNYHLKKQADITIVYQKIKPEELRPHTTLQIYNDGRIYSMDCSVCNLGSNASMETYFMEKDLLVELIERSIKSGGNDLLKDGIVKNLDNLKVCGYRYDGYTATIDSIKSYYGYHMDLLNPSILEETFSKWGMIYTKSKDDAPVKYKANAEVENSLIANGCVIEGKVEDSILFRGVRVAKGAHLKGCIVMQKGEIGENVVLENVICDKNVHILDGKLLKGEKVNPLLIEKGAII